MNTLVFKQEISGSRSAAGQGSYLERRVATSIHLAESDAARADGVYSTSSSLFHGGVDLVALTAGTDSAVLHTTLEHHHYLRFASVDFDN